MRIRKREGEEKKGKEKGKRESRKGKGKRKRKKREEELRTFEFFSTLSSWLLSSFLFLVFGLRRLNLISDKPVSTGAVWS
jgi:hypothetical protein